MNAKTKIRPIETNSVLKGMFERAEIKDEKHSNWNDLNGLYQSIAESLVQIATQVMNVVCFCEQTGYTRTAVEEQTIVGLRKDLDEFSTRLLEIKASHSERSGFVKDDDENAAFADCYIGYNAFFERLQSVTFDSMLTLTEMQANATAYAATKEKEASAVEEPVGD